MKDLNLIFGFTGINPDFRYPVTHCNAVVWENLFIWQFNWGGFLLKSNGGVQRYTKNWMETNRYITKEEVFFIN